MNPFAVKEASADEQKTPPLPKGFKIVPPPKGFVIQSKDSPENRVPADVINQVANKTSAPPVEIAKVVAGKPKVPQAGDPIEVFEQWQDWVKNNGAQLSASRTPFKQRTPEEQKVADEEVRKFQIERIADNIVERATGATIEDIQRDVKRFNGVMARAPLFAFALTGAPLIALGFESLTQAKNAVVTTAKNEKFDPFETRILTELLPEETPFAVKLGTGILEVGSEIALMGAIANKGKEGLLRQSIKEIGKKLEKAGYTPDDFVRATGKQPVIDVQDLKNAVKGTSLEDEAVRLLKAKSLKISPKVKIAGPQASVSPKPATPTTQKPLIKSPIPQTGAVGKTPSAVQARATQLKSTVPLAKETQTVSITKPIEPKAVKAPKEVQGELFKGTNIETPPVEPPNRRVPPSSGDNKPPRNLKGELHQGEPLGPEYEKQKDIWIGNKDVRKLKASIEKKRLQQEIKAVSGNKKFLNKDKGLGSSNPVAY